MANLEQLKSLLTTNNIEAVKADEVLSRYNSLTEEISQALQTTSNPDEISTIQTQLDETVNEFISTGSIDSQLVDVLLINIEQLSRELGSLMHETASELSEEEEISAEELAEAKKFAESLTRYGLSELTDYESAFMLKMLESSNISPQDALDYTSALAPMFDLDTIGLDGYDLITILVPFMIEYKNKNIDRLKALNISLRTYYRNQKQFENLTNEAFKKKTDILDNIKNLDKNYEEKAISKEYFKLKLDFEYQNLQQQLNAKNFALNRIQYDLAIAYIYSPGKESVSKEEIEEIFAFQRSSEIIEFADAHNIPLEAEINLLINAELVYELALSNHATAKEISEDPEKRSAIDTLMRGESLITSEREKFLELTSNELDRLGSNYTKVEEELLYRQDFFNQYSDQDFESMTDEQKQQFNTHVLAYYQLLGQHMTLSQKILEKTMDLDLLVFRKKGAIQNIYIDKSSLESNSFKLVLSDKEPEGHGRLFETVRDHLDGSTSHFKEERAWVNAFITQHMPEGTAQAVGQLPEDMDVSATPFMIKTAVKEFLPDLYQISKLPERFAKNNERFNDVYGRIEGLFKDLADSPISSGLKQTGKDVAKYFGGPLGWGAFVLEDLADVHIDALKTVQEDLSDELETVVTVVDDRIEDLRDGRSFIEGKIEKIDKLLADETTFDNYPEPVRTQLLEIRNEHLTQVKEYLNNLMTDPNQLFSEEMISQLKEQRDVFLQQINDIRDGRITNLAAIVIAIGLTVATYGLAIPAIPVLAGATGVAAIGLDVGVSVAVLVGSYGLMEGIDLVSVETGLADEKNFKKHGHTNWFSEQMAMDFGVDLAFALITHGVIHASSALKTPKLGPAIPGKSAPQLGPAISGEGAPLKPGKALPPKLDSVIVSPDMGKASPSRFSVDDITRNPMVTDLSRVPPITRPLNTAPTASIDNLVDGLGSIKNATDFESSLHGINKFIYENADECTKALEKAESSSIPGLDDIISSISAREANVGKLKQSIEALKNNPSADKAFLTSLEKDLDKILNYDAVTKGYINTRKGYASQGVNHKIPFDDMSQRSFLFDFEDSLLPKYKGLVESAPEPTVVPVSAVESTAKTTTAEVAPRVDVPEAPAKPVTINQPTSARSPEPTEKVVVTEHELKPRTPAEKTVVVDETASKATVAPEPITLTSPKNVFEQKTLRHEIDAFDNKFSQNFKSLNSLDQDLKIKIITDDNVSTFLEDFFNLTKKLESDRKLILDKIDEISNMETKGIWQWGQKQRLISRLKDKLKVLDSQKFKLAQLNNRLDKKIAGNANLKDLVAHQKRAQDIQTALGENWDELVAARRASIQSPEQLATSSRKQAAAIAADHNLRQRGLFNRATTSHRAPRAVSRNILREASKRAPKSSGGLMKSFKRKALWAVGLVGAGALGVACLGGGKNKEAEPTITQELAEKEKKSRADFTREGFNKSKSGSSGDLSQIGFEATPGGFTATDSGMRGGVPMPPRPAPADVTPPSRSSTQTRQ